MTDPADHTRPQRLPAWLRRPIPLGAKASRVARTLADLNLATVCSGAQCPNRAECFACGTATFMILGEVCTRSCGFCAVSHASPQPVDPGEPRAVATAVERLDLKHAVITCVTRDDLPDGGASHFAATIAAVRARRPGAVIEVLTSDFQGDRNAIDTVIAAAPDIFNHNIETVPSLYARVRPQANYRRSLDVLSAARDSAAGKAAAACGFAETRNRKLYTKSGLMLGLGETLDEVRAVLRDLRAVGCDILTVGQYLAPSAAHLPVKRFVPPAEFDALAAAARKLGFAAVSAGPFVRSSYLAEDVFNRIFSAP